MHGASALPLELVALLVAAAAIAALASRWGLSAPLVLTAVGIVASFVPGVPAYKIDPELVLAGFLPPLLYATAIRTPFVDIRRDRRTIILLSVVMVLVTAFSVAGVAVWLLPGLPFASGVALGAVVAPPDAVAATSVARRVGMPRRIVSLLEGESLLNDATALVTLRTALAALSATLSVGTVAVDFGRAVVGGGVIGWLVAVAATPIRRRVRDPVIDTTLSLLVPYIAYLVAETGGGSGVLAVVVAGLILGHRSPEIQSAASRVTERTIWRTVQFLLESVVFLLIGLQLRNLLHQALASPEDNGRILVVCIAVVVTVIVVRIAWLFPSLYLPFLLPSVRRTQQVPPWQSVALVSWAGMRGVVTVAAAFTLVGSPMSETLIIAAFAVVVASLLLQGATLPGLVRLLKVAGPDPGQDTLQQALVLQRAVHAGRQRLREEAGQAPADVVRELEAWGERLAHAVWERLRTSDAMVEPPARAFRRLRVAMLAAERDVVVEVNRSGRVAPDVLEAVMERLDQEEAMLTAFAEATATSGEVLAPPQDPDACEHLLDEALYAVPDNPDACEDCVAIGETSWVALRMCLRCGHVGCCDSSPHRHAEGHFATTRHPVMRSIELGEAWRWCYLDHQLG